MRPVDDRLSSSTTAPLVYKPKDAFRVRLVWGSAVLIVFCALLTIPAVASGAVDGMVLLPSIALVTALGLCTELRRRVVVTTDDLIVQGRLTRTTLRLTDITAVHYEKRNARVDRHRLIVWVAATGERPFRIYFLLGYPAFVADLRRRAAAAGADIDIDADMLAEPPADTRLLFTLL